MNLFNILKINTSYIMSHNLDINISYLDAMNDNLIVSLGDNQLFTFVRRLRENTDIVDEINDTKTKIQQITKLENSKENVKLLKDYKSRLRKQLFMPDIVSIKVDTTKKDYKYICKNMFKVKIQVEDIVYEKTYKRLCAGAGQLRRNSSLFVSEDLYDELEVIMMCGLTKSRIGKINLAKFSAYYALYTSATKRVKTPNICVVKDFEYTLKDQPVEWIFDKEDDSKDIEERIIDFDINAFDGSGIISPRMAEIWQENLKLDYLPSSFIIRSAWVKGLVSVFDFHKFAKEVAHKDYIVDAWGNKKNIDDIDVIMTTSQFKMWKKYESWEEYKYYYTTFKHIFSIARVNKKEDNFLTTLNYQYIQTNDFTEETIKGLSDYSLDWAKSIMNKDYLSTLLFLSTNSNIQMENREKDTIDDVFKSALIYCPELMEDEYFNKSMTRKLQNRIDKMKIGKIWVEGAYEFSIPDLYAMCEHAFGMGVKGLIPPESIWNRRWVEKGSSKVTAMRSPLVAPSENRLLDIYSSETATEWFSYIKSGDMFSIWDMTLIAMSDADIRKCPRLW